MAKGKNLDSSQRGIAFSTISALEVSALILIVGAGTFDQPSDGVFSILVLSGLIKKYIGEIGVMVFAIGFVAAALSSMLAVPLGAGITVQSVFTECEEERDQAHNQEPLLQLKVVDQVETTTQEESKAPLNAENRTAEDAEEGKEVEGSSTKYVYWTIISIMVIVATIVISLDGEIIYILHLHSLEKRGDNNKFMLIL